jgi:hypothetical protein
MPHLGSTTAHQLVDALLAALRTLDDLVAPKDQALKFLIALLTIKLKNGHTHSLMGNLMLHRRGGVKTKIKSDLFRRSGLPLFHSADQGLY